MRERPPRVRPARRRGSAGCCCRCRGAAPDVEDAAEAEATEDAGDLGGTRSGPVSNDGAVESLSFLADENSREGGDRRRARGDLGAALKTARRPLSVADAETGGGGRTKPLYSSTALAASPSLLPSNAAPLSRPCFRRATAAADAADVDFFAGRRGPALAGRLEIHDDRKSASPSEYGGVVDEDGVATNAGSVGGGG